jgi:hypothetical protein
MPPPGPCEAKALPIGNSAQATAARDSWNIFRDMTISRDNRLRQATDENGAGFEIFRPMREPARAIRIHICGADIHSAFTSLPLVLVSALRRYGNNCRTTSGCHPYPRRIHVNVKKMSVKKVFGFLTIGGLLVLAAPAERAQALSLASPGIAAAVQDDSSKLTTEVRWHRHHGWRRHHGWHRHHWRHRHWRRW